MDIVTSRDESAEAAPKDERRPWQPLGYDKIDAAQAEAGFVGIGVDNGSYS